MIINKTHSEPALDIAVPSIASGMDNSISTASGEGAPFADYMEVDINNLTVQTNASLFGAQGKKLVERFSQNRAIGDQWHYVLISIYLAMIICGTVGNIFVVIAVVRKPIMRTARNLFILNLAISDLLLCVITMPITLLEILSKYWPFGMFEVICKSVAMLQAVSIFVSTISITAIAFDRYQLIVYPTRESLQVGGVIAILAGIWLFAVLLASPLFIYKRLEQAEIPPLLQSLGIHGVCFCVEDWPVSHGRFYYSIFSLCVQYLVPILIVSGAYFGIYKKLRSRTTVVAMQTPQRKAERGRRMQRTNCLLITIALIFGISWMPLNVYNLYADMRSPMAVTERMLVIYACCHMFGMSSACTNPLLYGWLNDNFRSGQTRRRRKHAEISKGDLKLLPNNNGVGQRSAVTESIALTENPISTEVTTLTADQYMLTSVEIL
ncbi:neuropeptide F receptor isoform X3 [Zeugodacus cucurbitae]|uniref:neuropeptide F receptor isoform X3 n=1 Tax=Zeugodacus cucurbitae TaxID=28588 RepID=UPI0023D96EB4|nr:neuropeptide F receptor isoform X3 [Zeugodacus cucurbitae]